MANCVPDFPFAATPHSLARILVVEREPEVARELQVQLASMDYQVCACVDNGAAALAAASAQRPDLVLINVVLDGEIDGITVAARIGAELRVPVLFLTAYGDDDSIGRALRATPSGYLLKPFRPRELRAQIELALQNGALQRRLRDSEQWLAATLRGVGDVVVATDAGGRICYMNPAAEALLGWSLAEASGRPIDSVVRLERADGGPMARSPAQRALAGEAAVLLEHATLLVTRDGLRCPIDDSVAPIHGDHGKLLGVVMVCHDVRQQMEAERKLRNSEERFRAAFTLAPGGMALAGLDGRFQQVNGALCRLLGRGEQELLGSPQADFTDPADLAVETAHLDALREGRCATAQYEKRYRASDGNSVSAEISVCLLPQHGQPAALLFQVHDISARKLAEARLARLAHFDTLTGLANRASISAQLEQQLAAARRSGARLAVVFIDIDNFKHVNDSLGHEAGDALLRVIGERLRGAVRASDSVGRLGGDEFILLLPEIGTLDDILAVTGKVRTSCAAPVLLGEQQFTIGISLGVSLFPDDAQDARTLLRYADNAMYHAKVEGRNNLQFYRPELSSGLAQRMRLASELREALAQHQFELYFQPIMSLASGRPIAAEALLRWNHPLLGLLGPDSFLPLAEEIGLSPGIGAWVMQQACREAAGWTGALTVAVNVSPSQFKDGMLASMVQQALQAAGLTPRRLCVEITEQLLLRDSAHNRATVAALRASGVAVSLDDFGTGYSSLSYLDYFGPSEIKLDRSLIATIDHPPHHAAIVRAAVAMAHSLRLMVVGEGVEQEAQRQFLAELGCEMAQGFLFQAPCPAHEFRTWLQANTPA